MLRAVYPGWWIVLAGVLSLMLSTGATMYVFSLVVEPMERELGWSRSLLYGAVSVSAVVSSIVAGFVGPLFDRYGARSMMAVSSLVSGAALLLVPFSEEPWHLYLLVGGVLGAARAFSSLGPRTAIANWFIRRRPSAYATYTVGGPLSGIILVPPLAWLLNFTDWRAVWVILGVLEVALRAPLCWAVFRHRRPEEAGLLPDGEAASTRDSGEGSLRLSKARGDAAPVERPEDRWTRSAALRTPAFWLVALGFTCTQFAGTGITIHIAPYGLDKGLSATGAAAILTSYSIGAVLARVVWAHVIRRFGMYRSMIAFALTYAVNIAAVTLAPDVATAYIAACAVGLTAGAIMPLQGQVWPDYYGRNIVGALAGYSTLVQLPAQAFAPFGAALLRDLTGSYVPVFAAFATLSLLAALLFMLARPPVLRYDGRG